LTDRLLTSRARAACATTLILASVLSHAQAPPRIRAATPFTPSSPVTAGVPSSDSTSLPLTSPLTSPVSSQRTYSNRQAIVPYLVPPPTNLMGANPAASYDAYGAYGAVSPSASASISSPSLPITALQIAQSFLAADLNRDGELTRAEAQRLNLMPNSFEHMDRNYDGILSRFEYEDGVR
jgi:hypothetical protein